MIKKLIKREFISTWKTMLALYAAMLIAAGAGRLLNVFGGNSEATLMQTVVNLVSILNDIILALGAFLTLYVVAQRVYSSMLGDEGKTTMSLPVTVRAHLTARFAVAMVWSAGTIGFSIFAYWIYHAALPPVVTVFVNYDFGFFYYFMAALLALLIAAVCVSGVFLSAALGHLFYKQRLLASLLCGVGVFAVLGGLSYLALEYRLLEKPFGFLGESTVSALSDYGAFGAVFFIVLCVVCFECANRIISKRLNLLRAEE